MERTKWEIIWRERGRKAKDKNLERQVERQLRKRVYEELERDREFRKRNNLERGRIHRRGKSKEGENIDGGESRVRENLKREDLDI